MMWNWLVGGLATGSSIFLFDGAPVYPKIDVLLEYCQNKKINLFGVSAKYIDHLKNEKYNSKNLDLSSIKIITSTGSPLAEESFKYVYDNLKKDVHLASIAGGTDLVGCLVLGNLYSNVYMGEIQGQSLGIDVDVFTDEGKSVKDGEKGELVVKKPFPSMPVKFWGDDDGQKYHKAYFNKFENIWHHGDFIERTINNGFIMRGRSDATLNPGGVRIGTAEIYQQVEDIDFITQGLVIGQDYNDDVRVILFVTTKNDEELNDEKIESIKSKLPSYHGLIWGGSSLNIYNNTPEIINQIEFMKACQNKVKNILAICWGMQVAVTAAGGEVKKSSNGAHIGICLLYTSDAADE